MKVSQRRFRTSLLVLMLLAFGALTFGQEPGVQKRSNPLVKLSLIVTDGSNHSLDDLSKEEIQIIEEKLPQTISFFAKDDRPVDYALAIDTSGSLRDLIVPALEAAESIIRGNRSADQTFIERFISSDKIQTGQEFTSNKTKLIEVLGTLYIEEGQSAVIDAIYVAVTHTAAYQPSIDRRHALVLITDGEDRASYYSENQLFKLLRATDVQVFIIGLVSQLKTKGITGNVRARAEKLLGHVAEETGGRVFFPSDVAELKRAASEISHDLHEQFVLGWQPTMSSGKENFRKVEINIIETPGREKLTAIARSGYLVNFSDSNSKEKKSN